MATTTARRPGRCGAFSATVWGRRTFARTRRGWPPSLDSCAPALIELLDFRFPEGATEGDVRKAFAAVPASRPMILERSETLADRIGLRNASASRDALRRFADLLTETGEPFNFSDCSLGNLVFAGFYLQCGRAFNQTVDEYASPRGITCRAHRKRDRWHQCLARWVGRRRASSCHRRGDGGCQPAPSSPRHLPDRSPAVGIGSAASSRHRPTRRSAYLRIVVCGQSSTPGSRRSSRPPI